MLSDRIMIISFAGRKTGKSYSTPVSYCQEDRVVYCYTHAGWWKNLIGGVEVNLVIRGQNLTGTAMPVTEDRDRKIIGLRKLLTAVPSDAVFYNVKIDKQGNLDTEDLAQAVNSATMIEVHLDDTSLK